MASFGYGGRSLRGRRSLKGRFDVEEEQVHIDYSKAPSEIIHNILIHVVKQETSKSCKLGYLNGLVKFCNKIGSCNELGFSKEELFCCLRLALLHEACEVRAAGLRALRYLLWDRDSVEALCRVQMPLLIARCLDVVLDNRIERVQALRLVRKILSVDPHQFPCALTNCLVAIASDGAQERDILARSCLAVLSELALLNPEACTTSGGLSAILRNVLDCQQPQIGETLIGIILFLLNDPKTRYLLGNSITLEHLMAPFTDNHFRYSADISDSNASEDREMRFTASKQAIISALRSWSGLIYLCRPGHLGLQSLIDMLYLPYSDIRKNILDLLYDLFSLPMPEWTEDFTIALLSSDPSTMQCSWQLYEGFVAAEGNSILPPVTKHRTNLVENYFALLLLAFVQTGLLEAIVEVITCSDTYLSIRATVLLGELLHMANRLLPSECSHHCSCLPTLVSMATSFESFPKQRNQASAAISCLNQIHVLKKRNIVPCSLFLDQLLHFCNPHISKEKHLGDSISRTKLWHYLKKDADDMINQAIKDSQVLQRDYINWDWDLIGTILKWPYDLLRKLEDVSHRSFIKKLIHFYKPTSKQFSSVEVERENGYQMCVVGCHVIDFLLEAEEMKAFEFIDEFLTDVNLCLSQVTVENAPVHAVLSPTRLVNTLSHAYFLFIGRLSSSHKGRKFLDKSGVSQYLFELVSVTSHDTYIKLIVSSLDYTKDGFSRAVLSKILTSTSETARLYATNYMRVLMRAKLLDFHKWAIELLVTQLCDTCRAVSLAAADILEEACDIQENLEALISLRPPLLHYGDKGLLLLLRFLSVTGGFRFLRDSNFLGRELQKWNTVYNLKYVKIVEDCLNEALTHHRRGEDGAYGHRFSSDRYRVYSAFIPPHMYGQLACHKEGLDMLLREECLTPLFETIKTSNYVYESNILHLKAALWAIGNIGTSAMGLSVILEASIIPQIVKLAQEATVFSVRGTCFYVLGLLSSTPEGADLMSHYGWEAIRRTHDEKWPLTWTNIAFDELTDDSRSYAWSLSSNDSEWLGESFASRLSFFTGVTEEGNTNLPNTPSSYSLCLEENYTPSYKQPIKWNVSESNIFPSRDESHDSHSLPRHNMFETRPRSSSDGRSTCSSDCKIDDSGFDGEKFVSKPEIIWKIGSSDDIIKDRSSSFGGTQETVNKNSVKERSISDLEVSRKTDTSPSYLLGSKGERSSSNESSHTSASKSRSGSSTESTTSGISSCDSTAPRLYHSDHPQTLSPIASSTSLNTMSNRSTPCTEHFHRSVVISRPLSLISRSVSHNYCPNSPDELTPTFSFTSARDALGYVTLKGIKKKRMQSMSFEEEKYTWPEIRKLKSRSLEPDIHYCDLGCDYFDVVESASTRRASVSSQSSTIASSTGKVTDVEQENIFYIGLCLPVDYRMVFSLHDCKECGTSASEVAIEQHDANEHAPENTTVQQSYVDGLILHTENSCMACKKWHLVKVLQISEIIPCESDETILTTDQQEACSPCESGIYSPALTDKHSVKSSVESTEVAMPESYISISTMEGGTSQINEETNWGRSLIYKEVMRFVTNMSSSIALKASEQGLLNLKQKFPDAFQDICLYTEISLYLANYSFPLNARRFLQELFLDTNFTELYRDAEALLDVAPCVITLSKIDSSDA